MKGIILHGGHGTRLRPLTHAGPKQLLPIANKPMSQYALEDLKHAEITDIAIIIGDIYPQKVKEYYGDGSKFGVKISYIYQDQPKGIAHAIGLCKDFVANEKFVVYLGDNVLRKDLNDYVTKFTKTNKDGLILLCKVNDPTRFGIAEMDKNDPNKIKKIVEKPKSSASNLAVIGIYFLTPKIFEIISSLKPSWRNELEITDALQLLIEKGNDLDFEIVTGWWKDTGTPEDILDANRLVLDSIGKDNQFHFNENYKIDGNVIIGKNTTISDDSIMSGPVIIGNNCVIGSSSKIGPFVSIGNNSIIKHCKISNSIIMENCTITKGINIQDSIIANGSSIDENSSRNTFQFMLGERSRIKL